MRLQKYLARCGVASRRKSEELIRQGLVTVNGKTIREMGFVIDSTVDVVTCRGKIVEPEERTIVALLNKPVGYVTTSKDQFGRKSVTDLVSDLPERLVPVGRLDYHSSGLLLMTNDGDLTYRLTHPKYHVPKVYRVKINGYMTYTEINRFRDGMIIDGYKTKPAGLMIVESTDTTSVLEITLHEGRNRQIRKMLGELGYEVLELERIAIGFLTAPDLKPGQYRLLTEAEVQKLKGEHHV